MLALLLLLPPGINCKRKIAVFPPRPEQQAQDESVPCHSPLTGGDLVALFACVKQRNQLFHGANSLEKSSFRALVALFDSELRCSPPSNSATKRLACVGFVWQADMGDEATMPEGVAKCVKHARLGCAESLPKPFCIDDHICSNGKCFWCPIISDWLGVCQHAATRALS